MKVRISYTVEVSDYLRRAIRHYYGETGLATREEVKDWIERYGSSEDDNLVQALQNSEDADYEPEQTYDDD